MLLDSIANYKSSNISVNNNRYYQNDFQFPFENWEELRNCTPVKYDHHTGLISYQNFVNGLGYIVRNIERAKDNLVNPNQPITLVNVTTANLKNAIDAYYFVETEKCLQLSMSTNTTAITIGNNVMP